VTSEGTRAGLTVLALAAGVVALISLAGSKTHSGGHRTRSPRKKRKSTRKPTAKTKRFDGRGYTFSGSHHYKADATKAANALRKQGKSARVSSFRFSANSKPQWGVFVR